MKRTIIIFLSLIPLFTMAQEPEIIGGYLLDGKDSFEELDAAVLTESKSKEKNLEGKGLKIPGGSIFMTPESVGKEIGSLVRTKRQFIVKTISFTVESNGMEGCKANLRIYRMESGDSLVNIVTMPIYQDIPKVTEETTFSIAPEESIVLDPGEYYISFCLSEIGQEIKDRWAESESWSDDERLAMYRQDRIHFPLHLKSSYTREGSDRPLGKWSANIGIEVRGIERKS
ncbi:MAG: hypothetical protein IJZ70_03745 [Bacteroidales bacterium]|nr:hypothetical protein [Bacteroidales bacterium]MBQ8811405.1 hypothetical protein [Bacteroidales bacterium]